MCGIAGFISGRIGNREDISRLVSSMTELMWRRGPDDQGIWVDADANVALGHRRLSIIDLSQGGHQPMVSRCSRYVITFNGELYNFRALRLQLESKQRVAWRSTSDTEVLVEAIATWGLDRALQMSNGMFAFGLWDRQERTLTLARDRLGEKPLYYGQIGSSFVFASELRPIQRFAKYIGASLSVDREALSLLLEFQYIPAPWSIFSGIKKLPPASTVVARANGVTDAERYWDLKSVVERCREKPFSGSADEAIDLIERQLLRTVQSRMESDVPLGAFLSGGVDSGLLVAMMQQVSTRPVRTFTIGFELAENDESVAAEEVARHLGTDHTTLRVTGEQSLEAVSSLPEYYDEPFSDASQVPTQVVSRLAREYVTVSISGDGGDEVFGGYNRYLWALRIGRAFGILPPFARRFVGKAIDSIPESLYSTIFSGIRAVTPVSSHVRSPIEKMQKIASLCSVAGVDKMYEKLTRSRWSADSVVLGQQSGCKQSLPELPAGLSNAADQMMYWDMLGYLPDDVLTKVDRASMSVGLESRAPYLDHELIELSWRLSGKLKVRNGTKKWITRQILSRHVPSIMVNRPKSGFETPLFLWLRGPLRDWANDLLSESRLRREGYFDAEVIRRVWDEHQSGRARCHYELWSVLMFEQWLSTFKNS